jgi:hypothetical protein
MKEFSFLIGNCPGALVEIATELKKDHVNIEGIAGLTVLEEGVVSLATDNPDVTRKKLKEANIDFEEREVLVMDLPHHPGEIATVLDRLEADHINVLSIYAGVEKNQLLFTVDQPEKTKQILRLE